jgi:error-prone DNA polymerase
MGFYSPHSLVQDARRHGVTVRTPDLNESGVDAILEWDAAVTGGGRAETKDRHPSSRGTPEAAGAVAAPTGGVVGPQPVERMGLSSVRAVGPDLAEAIVAERDEHGPYRSMEDLKRRIAERAGSSSGRRPKLELSALEALATAGAFGCFAGNGKTAGGAPETAPSRPLDRRRALWGAGAVAQTGADRLPGIVTGVHAPPLPGMTDREVASADLWATGVSPDGHPTRFLRDELDRLGVVPASGLAAIDDGSRVLVGGVVTHRQRPATAGGTTFINLEDETGLINIVCSKGCWARYRTVARSSPALLIRGRLEKVEGVINIVAEKLEALPVPADVRSRDFR